jgi:putative drug exporter of the RND superfamily
LRRGIDASVQPIAIIRGLLAAAFVAILRRWKWWLPARSARIFRVKASPIHAEPAPQTT